MIYLQLFVRTIVVIFYPSASGSLVLSEAITELRNNNIVDFLKVKGSWAKVGRVAPIYGTDTYYSAANPTDGFDPQIVFPFLGLQGRSIDNTAGNSLLGSEFTRSVEGGTGIETTSKERIGTDGIPLRNYVIDGVVGSLNADGTIKTERPNTTAMLH